MQYKLTISIKLQIMSQYIQRHRGINKIAPDLSPWSYEHSLDDEYSFDHRNPSQLPEKKRFNIQRFNKPVFPDRDISERKQEKNQVKIIDYNLPPLLTRRSIVLLKESKDSSTLDDNNFYYQRKISGEKYRYRQISKKVDNMDIQSLNNYRHMFRGRSARKLPQNISQSDKIMLFRLSGKQYHLISANKNIKGSNNQIKIVDQSYEEPNLPASKIYHKQTKNQILKSVLDQLRGKTIEI